MFLTHSYEIDINWSGLILNTDHYPVPVVTITGQLVMEHETCTKLLTFNLIGQYFNQKIRATNIEIQV